MSHSSKNLGYIIFDDVNEWKKVNFFSSIEQVIVVIVPKQMHRDKEAVKVKLRQQANFEKFDFYDETEDLAQEKITGTWIVVKKETDCKEGIKARWVAGAFQEKIEIKPDSPTVSKLCMRVLFAITASREWPRKVINVKSAFLQGGQLDRSYIKPLLKKRN